MGFLSTIRALVQGRFKEATNPRPTGTPNVSGRLPLFDIETVRRVIDNRTFLLGLDTLYREAIKPHERGELLLCARRVALALQVTAANVPVEGYYADDDLLSEYFRLVRSLQEVDGTSEREVTAISEFQRLREVTSAPLFGRPIPNGKLLPKGHDAVSQALLDTPMSDWSVTRLTDAAHRAALAFDDISLVGLAARAREPVVLGELRESVVLYAEPIIGAKLARPEFVWQVDSDLARQAQRFIDTFNALFGAELPSATADHAERYWHACNQASIFGRCVRLGCTDTKPELYYHWAICYDSDGQLIVQEFWHEEIWTTKRYREALAERMESQYVSVDDPEEKVPDSSKP